MSKSGRGAHAGPALAAMRAEEMPKLRAKALELAIQAAPLVRGGSGMRSMPPITDLDLFSDAQVILQWLMTGKAGAGNSTEAG